MRALKQERMRMSGLNRSKAFMCFIAALLVSLPATALQAQALGITPGRSTIDFSPGLQKDITFTITSTEHKAFNAYIYKEGDLADYIYLDKTLVEFTEADDSKTFTFRVKLPEKIDTPGDHWGRVVVMELPSGWTAPEGETKVVATVAVMHQVKVNVPYPGKFAQLDMSVQEAVPGEPVKFFVKMYNLGKDDIAAAQASIDILGPTNEVIATVETKPSPIKSMERGELMAVWDADTNPGMYHASATVRYDGEVGKTEKNFYVGNMLIEVTDISVKDFRLGGVAKFDIQTESKWNQEIKDVYAQMVISDSKDNKVADIKSSSMDMQPLEKAHLYTYWDTEGVVEGDYNAKLSLHYGDRVTEKEIKTKVGLADIRMDFSSGTSGAVTGGTDILSQAPIIILVVVLIAINLAWFLYFRSRRKGK
jgi:hypothetical protein